MQKRFRLIAKQLIPLDFSPSERRRLDELAHLDVVMPADRQTYRYTFHDPYHYSFVRPSCSYTDLRRNSDVPPPSYKTTESTICTGSLCDIDL